MSLRRLGKTWLGTFVPETTSQFPTDPHIQRNWPPRRSRLSGIQGSTTQQDFGRWASDLRLTLVSQGNYIDHDFKIYLDNLMNSRLQVYAYEDYQGITATVVIVDFSPTPTFLGDASSDRDGGGILWEYTLVLDVITMTKLDFAAYGGV
jgi:hypothetical protein